MPRRASAHPTEAELELLNILWRHGPRTVRQVHEIVQADRDTSLTTTLSILQIMTKKGLVLCSDTRPHIYTAAVPEEQTQAGLVKDLVRKAFGGSIQKLLVRAVGEGGLSREELREIRKLIDGMRRK